MRGSGSRAYLCVWVRVGPKTGVSGSAHVFGVCWQRFGTPVSRICLRAHGAGCWCIPRVCACLQGRHPGPCWPGSRHSEWNCGSTCPRGVRESLVYQKGLRMYVSDGRAGLQVRLACRRGGRHPCLGLGVDGQRLCCGTNADRRAELRVRMPACRRELEGSRWFALVRLSECAAAYPRGPRHWC